MHYLALSNGFGVFDRDNQYRWEMAGYLNWSNAVRGRHRRPSRGAFVSGR